MNRHKLKRTAETKPGGAPARYGAQARRSGNRKNARHATRGSSRK